MQNEKMDIGHNHPVTCRHCGCQVSEPGWRNCPRCQQDLGRCGGCLGCGNCKRS